MQKFVRSVVTTKSLLARNQNYTSQQILHKLTQLTEEVKDFKKEFKGFAGNVAKSHEEEVTEAVKQHLLTKGIKVQHVALSHSITIRGKRVGEADGLIYTDDGLVVVEAKSTVQPGAISQLTKLCGILSNYERCSVVGFLGAPVFPANLKDQAMKKHVGIVELSGKRYRVLEPEQGSKKQVQIGQ